MGVWTIAAAVVALLMVAWVILMQNATEGTIKETTYWWPRPGSDEAFEKTVFYTKAGDQICAVGYYKGTGR
jgi:hypothetical protein